MGKRDHAWKYGLEHHDEKGYLKTKCNFCNIILASGISRLKNHLVGNHKDVAPCTRVPADVKAEISAQLGISTSKKTDKETQVAEKFTLGSHYEKLHSGVGSSHNSVPVSDRAVRGPLDPYFALRSTEEGITPPSTSDLAKAARKDIARYFYENSIPFNVARSPSFIGMCRTLGNFGRGLSIPTPYDISGPLLEEENICIERVVDEVKRTWLQTGVSIISDGWKDARGRQLINFLVNNPHGTVFLRTIDALDAVKTGLLLFEMLDKVVMEVGEDLVVQVVTDNASNYAAAGRMLMEKRTKLYWTPCAAHCIDLMLEKIGDLPQHSTALRKAKKVTKFIYNHGFVLAMMREQVKKDLVRPAATRFGTAYLTLQSMFDLKQPLQSMFTSVEWSRSTYSKTSEGKKVRKIVMDEDSFWTAVDYAIKTTLPLFKVLRMADSEKMPGMGFLYAGVDKAKGEIMANLDNNEGAYKEIIDIIDLKWGKQMHRPLHAAAAMLNPHFAYSSVWDPPLRIRNTIYDVISRLVPDTDAHEKMDLQLESFKKKTGIFGRDLCRTTATQRTPADWWEAYGNDTPELQSFAIKVLSLTCSSSACERNWSTFNQIHTKKRNRLSVEKMNSLAYVMYNRKLRERHLKKIGVIADNEELELVNLDDIPSDDEWIAGDDDNVEDSVSALGTQAIAEETTQSEEHGEDSTQASQGGGSTQRSLERTYKRKRKTTSKASLVAGMSMVSLESSNLGS